MFNTYVTCCMSGSNSDYQKWIAFIRMFDDCIILHVCLHMQSLVSAASSQPDVQYSLRRLFVCRSYTHTHTHTTERQTDRQTCLHSLTLSHTRTHTHTHTHTNTHTQQRDRQTDRHAYTHSLSHTHTHARTHSN